MTDPLTTLRETVQRATPGPWSVGELASNDLGVIADGFGVARLVGWPLDPTVSKANAAHIVLADRLARIIAEPGTVEVVARLLGKLRWPAATEEERNSWADKYWHEYVREATAVLNFLASQALQEPEQ